MPNQTRAMKQQFEGMCHFYKCSKVEQLIP